MIGARLKLIASATLCGVFALTSAFLFFNGEGLRRERNALVADIETPVTGFRDRLAACRATAQTLEGQVQYQSERVREWQAEADRVKAEGERATLAAQAKARDLERQLVGARRAQPLPGETVCQAADRLIMERVG